MHSLKKEHQRETATKISILKISRCELTFPELSSAKMQPIDHMSIFWSYGSPRMTSGARYERDCTYEHK